MDISSLPKKFWQELSTNVVIFVRFLISTSLPSLNLSHLVPCFYIIEFLVFCLCTGYICLIYLGNFILSFYMLIGRYNFIRSSDASINLGFYFIWMGKTGSLPNIIMVGVSFVVEFLDILAKRSPAGHFINEVGHTSCTMHLECLLLQATFKCSPPWQRHIYFHFCFLKKAL